VTGSLIHIRQKQKIALKIAVEVASVNGPLEVTAQNSARQLKPETMIKKLKIGYQNSTLFGYWNKPGHSMSPRLM
jgi:hypothetical protein